MESATVKIKNPFSKKYEEFTMKESLWLEDQQDINRLKDATGKQNITELWFTRLSKALGVSDADVRKFPAWKLSGLIVWWLYYNDVEATSFLEEPMLEKKITS